MLREKVILHFRFAIVLVNQLNYISQPLINETIIMLFIVFHWTYRVVKSQNYLHVRSLLRNPKQNSASKTQKTPILYIFIFIKHNLKVNSHDVLNRLSPDVGSGSMSKPCGAPIYSSTLHVSPRVFDTVKVYST